MAVVRHTSHRPANSTREQRRRLEGPFAVEYKTGVPETRFVYCRHCNYRAGMVLLGKSRARRRLEAGLGLLLVLLTVRRLFRSKEAAALLRARFQVAWESWRGSSLCSLRGDGVFK